MFIVVPTGFKDISQENSGSIYTITLGRYNELASGHVMARYYRSSSNSNSGSNCGCSALAAYGGQRCDRCLVCGGNSSTVDCNGECFGSAFIDKCGKCAGGHSGIIPNSQCQDQSSSESDGYMSYVIQTLVLLMSICGFGLLVSGCLIWMRRMRVGDRGDIQVQMTVPSRRPVLVRAGLTEAELADFEVFNISALECEIEGVGFTECSICLGNLAPGDLCKRMPPICGHIFHLKCIDEWLRMSKTCPLCKRDLRPNSAKSIEDRDVLSDALSDLSAERPHRFAALNTLPSLPSVSTSPSSRYPEHSENIDVELSTQLNTTTTTSISPASPRHRHSLTFNRSSGPIPQVSPGHSMR